MPGRCAGGAAAGSGKKCAKCRLRKSRFYRKDGQGLHYRLTGSTPPDIIFIFESYDDDAKNECDELATRIREALGHRAASDRPARPAMISKNSFRS